MKFTILSILGVFASRISVVTSNDVPVTSDWCCQISGNCPDGMSFVGMVNGNMVCGFADDEGTTTCANTISSSMDFCDSPTPPSPPSPTPPTPTPPTPTPPTPTSSAGKIMIGMNVWFVAAAVVSLAGIIN